jgi:hypothetical protein
VIWTLISESMLSGGKDSKETAPTVWPMARSLTFQRPSGGSTAALFATHLDQMLHGSHVRNAVHGWRQPSSDLSVPEDAQGRFNIGHRPRSKSGARSELVLPSISTECEL